MNMLKALSALLTYPSRELQDAVPEIERIFEASANLSDGARVQLRLLTRSIAQEDLYDLQERYTDLFDRTRSLSLHIFEHIHGESRDRGQAMVDLRNHYAGHGLEIDASELPDFVPMFLEFLSTLPPSEAADLLGQPINILTALGERLAKRQSAYQGVFQALVSLSSELPAREAVQELLAEPDPAADDLEALEAAWEDEAVQFGPGASPSCKDEIMTKVRAGRRLAPGMQVASNKPVIRYAAGGENA
ncbi:MAG TPA: nitrate reductase molybdenum cofactor assembly chaperone [Xanthobacteraceae bacterium]|nr:nitrate reductase molybdenum cofactor assembly chaperone [Xanthobacteraceae bacterium]